ncbi:MAG: hypothetical protein WCG27_11340, partial [Pseudomonadota bacterium]
MEAKKLDPKTLSDIGTQEEEMEFSAKSDVDESAPPMKVRENDKTVMLVIDPQELSSEVADIEIEITPSTQIINIIEESASAPADHIDHDETEIEEKKVLSGKELKKMLDELRLQSALSQDKTRTEMKITLGKTLVTPMPLPVPKTLPSNVTPLFKNAHPVEKNEGQDAGKGQKLEQNYHYLQIQIRKLLEQRKQYVEEINKLLKDKKDLESKHQRLAVTYRDLQGRSNDLSNQCEVSVKGRGDLEREVEHLQGVLEELRNNKGKLVDECHGWEVKSNRLKGETEAMDKTRNDRAREFETIKSEYDTESRALISARTELKEIVGRKENIEKEI